MQRLAQFIIVIVIVLAISTATKTYELIKDGVGSYGLINLAITVTLFAYSIIWFLQVRSKSARAKIMTLVFVFIPVLPAIFQVYMFWEDKEDIVFNLFASSGTAVLVGIYIRLIFRWLKKLNAEFDQIKKESTT